MCRAFPPAFAVAVCLAGATAFAQAPPATPPAAAAPVAAANTAAVAATVNGQPISEAAVQRALKGIAPAQRTQVREEILNLLALLNNELGKTIIMVTHDAHAAGAARALVHLEKGELIDGTAR